MKSSQHLPSRSVERRWLTWPIRHPYWTLLLCLTTTALLAMPASRVRSDNSSKIFELEDDPDRAFFNEYKEQFGANDFIVVTMTCDDLFTHENLYIVEHLTKWLEELPEVDDVTSLADVEDIKGSDEDFIVEPFFEEVPEDPAELAALRERALDKPLYVGGVVSSDGNTAGIIVELAPGGLTDAQRAHLVKTIQDQLRPLQRQHRRFAIAGRQVTDYYLGAYLNRDMGRLTPLSVCLMLLILFILFRHPLGIALPSILVGTAMVGGMGALQLVGGTNNMVTSILPPLMMATGIGLAIHLLTHYHELLLTGALPMGEAAPQFSVPAPSVTDDTTSLLDKWHDKLTNEHPSGSATDATPSLEDEIAAWIDHLGRIDHLARHNTLIVTHVVTELWRPCLAAALTTIAGFGSLAISHVPPIRHFGIAASAGVAYTLVMAFTLLPALLVVVRRPISRRHARPDKVDTLDAALASLGAFVSRHPRTILYTASAVAVGAIAGMFQLRVEYNGLEFFYPDAPVVRDTLAVEGRLAGTEDLRISLRAPEPNSLARPRALDLQEALAEWLRHRPEIDKVVTFPDYLKAMNRAFHDDLAKFYLLPDSAALVAQYLLLYDGKDLHDVLDDDRSWAALIARVHVHRASDLERLVSDTRTELTRVAPDLEPRVTGNTLQSVNLVDAITRAQIESLILACLLIFAVVSLLFRSLRDGLLAMPPNLLPILVNLGLMGWLDIPLNPATAMISAVAIGIAVDDTVHFLSAYRTARARGSRPTTAVQHTLLLRGRAMVSTSAVLFCAFAVLTISSFIPVVHFGLLTGMTMVSALVADLLVFPSMLLVIRRRGSETARA